MMDFEFARRCSYGANTTLQCALNEGHQGDHMNGMQVEMERRRNLHPTLADIRQVIREEIERALKRS